MDAAFWQKKRVFLTGHTGFKGSWLSLWLSQMGAAVHGYALEPPTEPSLFDLARVDERIDSEYGNVLDPERLRASLRAWRPDIVIHMAAQPIVRVGYADPVTTFATNVMGTVNLLEAVRAVDSVRVVLVITSDKCYENRGWVWGYRESDHLGGHDPYSASKACAEHVVASYRASFFSPETFAKHGVVVASARAGNVIGGGDWAKDRLVPDLMRAFLHSEAPLVRSPLAVRPWQHVLEPLSGYLLLCRRCLEDGVRFGEGWNFCPESGDSKPVGWIADRLAMLWGSGAKWRRDIDPHPHEDHYLYLDVAKAREQLGYRPRWLIDHVLERIVEWFRAYCGGNDMQAVTLGQIQAFMADGAGVRRGAEVGG